MIFFVLGFVIGALFGAAFVLLGDDLLTKYMPEDAVRGCPPCDNQCNQGRDCPANQNDELRK